ncbi:MAG: hypothetical protein EXQ70_06050 [Solirubrobacterales bacterium]|nr:hypothetical protein [Solirubrobacterales bacterium]
MRRPIPGPRSGLSLMLTALVCLTGASAAQAKTIGAQVRVLTGGGKTLADVRQQTDTTKVPTSPQARCFFGGVGGTGEPFTTEGPNALGIVADASRGLKRLRPLAITDEFSFGLGVCGFGGFDADAAHFWSVRVNHEALQVGGDQFQLQGGDRVLWALIQAPNCEPTPPYTCDPGPPELEIKAPARALPGDEFGVKVFEWSDTGHRTPAEGVQITGAAGPTASTGVAQVSLAASGKLSAMRTGALAASPLPVCVKSPLAACDAARGRLVLGSQQPDVVTGADGADQIKPGGGADRVNAKGGDDVINVRGGGTDRVKCGGGSDKVRADKSDKIARDCERVSRK